jgi:ribose transport system ATP-binding protein
VTHADAPPTSRPPLLEFEHVSKSFFGVGVLHDVSFSLGLGRVVGLVGENGAGKSTLMNLLGGVHRPDSGRMLLGGVPHTPRAPRDAAAAGVAFIHQELNLFTNLTVAENLHVESFPRRRLGPLTLPLVDRGRMHERTRELLAQVDLRVPPETPVAALSPGRRQLVEIARAIGAGARLVILDEPTTSLTAPEAERLFGLMRRLRAGGVSMVYVSHNLRDVREQCDDVVVLRDGRVVSAGPRDGYDERRLVSEMVGRAVEQLYPARAPAPPREPVLRVEGLCRPPAFRDVSLTVHAGEIVGLAGLMGAGRTELARAIFGADPVTSGRVILRGRPHAPSPRRSVHGGIAFLTENRREEGLLMDASVAENAALVVLPRLALRRAAGWVRRRALRQVVATNTAAVRLHGAALHRQTARTLSGGNQQKVVLAKWLAARPGVFLLDEPTRGIDVGAKQEVYRTVHALAAAGSAVLMISSEIEELIGMCDRILVMAAGRVCDEIARADFDRERILRAALGEAVKA